MWEDLGLGYFHLFENFPKQDVGQSTWVFLMMQLVISTLITIRCSCTRSITLKSSIVKVMGDMFGTGCWEIMYRDWTCQRCLFRAEVVALPPKKPPTMVFMTRFGRLRGLSSFSLERLQVLRFSDWSACSQSFPWLDSGMFLPLSLYDCDLWKKSFRWSSLMNSSILSSKALHSSVEWPRLW